VSADDAAPELKTVAILVMEVLTVEPPTSDRIAPEALFGLFRAMHGKFGGVVEKSGGTLHAMLGDSLIAVWGLERELDVAGARRAALACAGAQGDLTLEVLPR
jgi:hypothetical protein